MKNKPSSKPNPSLILHLSCAKSGFLAFLRNKNYLGMLTLTSGFGGVSGIIFEVKLESRVEAGPKKS